MLLYDLSKAVERFIHVGDDQVSAYRVHVKRICQATLDLHDEAKEALDRGEYAYALAKVHIASLKALPS
jgi:hypothetical protein